MAKIHTLKISNYRGIKSFEQVFGVSDFVCLIGRGDSGKTTILQAISSVLSPSWNYNVYDTDFHNINIEEPIEIEVSLYDLPPELLTENKFGLYKRLLTSKGEIIDDITQEDSGDNMDILTIRLQVFKDLEPQWCVINERENQESKEISANDRSRLNVFLVSDYFDRHFSWSKGNPLYSLSKQYDLDYEKDSPILDAFRDAKNKIDNTPFDRFNKIIEDVEASASFLGLDIKNTRTTLDFKDISLNEDKICLHDEKIPFRQRGKGSKRILSVAIQSELVKTGGIVLIDEIEQGLEPDRARFLVNRLKKQNKGQIFITTHSSNVIVELNANDLYLTKKYCTELIPFDKEFQGCIRKNPEAFFTKKILVCEGATEIGICRSIDRYRIKIGKDSFSILGIGLVDGTGSNFIDYCAKFQKAGFNVCAFCDSDDKSINIKKENLRDKNITIIDCDKDKSIEQQLFSDLPWSSVQCLIDYAIEEKSEESIKSLIKNQYGKETPSDWLSVDTPEIRAAIGGAAALKKSNGDKGAEDKGWFKRIDHGEFLGFIWMKSLEELAGKKLLEQYESISNWIDNV